MPHPVKLMFSLMLLFLFSFPCSVLAQLKAGDIAPDFTLEDVNGGFHQLGAMKNHSLIVLYFFDTASPASQEG